MNTITQNSARQASGCTKKDRTAHQGAKSIDRPAAGRGPARRPDRRNTQRDLRLERQIPSCAVPSAGEFRPRLIREQRENGLRTLEGCRLFRKKDL